MCRIVGGWEFSLGGGCLFKNIESMRDSMAFGGPDGKGVYFAKNVQVALAHRRLSIIDLSVFSNQPFISKDGRYVLVFNGEIYNYKELAKSLYTFGVECSGVSDVEVVMESFIAHGVECVKYFDGMFAFVMWDNLEQKMYLFRDRYGVKPLYYYFDGNVFLFSSELKGILGYTHLRKNINKEALSYFLSFGYIPAPFSILESCYKLESGHYLVLDSKKTLKRFCYYKLLDAFKQKQKVDKGYLELMLKTSIKRRMISDVPVSVCLSGGVDSSLVCAVLKDMGYSFETFSVTFKEIEFDESKFATSVAQHLNVPNHLLKCSIDEAKALIEDLPFVYDEPFGDSSAIPTLLLMRKISQTHKVVLSADGGDELMLGYDRYFWAESRYLDYKKFRLTKIFNIFFALSPKVAVGLANQFGIKLGIDKFLRIKNQVKAKSFLEHYLVEISHFRCEDLKWNHLSRISVPKEEMANHFDLMSYFDFSYYLCDDILVKTDRAGMSVGCEVREPLLGFEFVNYVVSLQSEDKARNNIGKILFKEYLERFLPKELIYRPKMGFGVPLQEWMQKDLRYLLDIIIEYSEEYLDKKYVKNLLKDFDSGLRVDFAKIWYIYSFCAWRKRWGI